MSDLMTFPDTVEEFMEWYKVTDTEQVYSNGTEYVPIFRMKQWFEHLSAAESERKAPTSDKEQLSLDCSFCREHECGDTLYESSDWDGGIGFDYIRNIRFCPICGRELYNDE